MSPTLTFQDLDNMLRGYINWDVTDDGLKITPDYRRSKSYTGTTHVVIDSLNSLHPQLYSGLQRLRLDINMRIFDDIEGDLAQDYADGRYPRALIRQMCAPLTVPGRFGADVSLAYVWDISWEDTNKRVTLHTMSYDLPHDAGTSIEDGFLIPSRVSSQQVPVKKEWLDNAFPGWENRFYTGQALGLVEEDLVDHVLHENVPVMAVVPPTDISPN